MVKVTGYRSLVTQHDWGRLIGDANGVMPEPRTEVQVLILETDGGMEGVGLGAHDDIDRVFGAVEGEDPRGVTALYDRMLDRVFKTGHSGATFGTIGAIDMALWDLKAKAAGEPLWRTLGGLDRFVPGYASGLDIALDDDALLRLYERFAERGFGAAKLKGGRNLEHDRRRLEALRELLGRNSTHPALMFDANESWNRSQAVRFVTALERTVELAWVEEPVRRWDAAGLASVRRGIRAAVAHGHDLPVSLVGFHANPVAHAATAVPNHLALEVQDLSSPIGLTVDQEIEDGGIVLGEEPGLGIRVDESQLRTLQTTTIAPSAIDGPHVRPDRAGLRLVPDSREPTAAGMEPVGS